MCVCVCVHLRERERENGGEGLSWRLWGRKKKKKILQQSVFLSFFFFPKGSKCVEKSNFLPFLRQFSSTKQKWKVKKKRTMWHQTNFLGWGQMP